MPRGMYHVTYPANQHVGFVEVATEHLGSFAGILDLDADFHAFAGRRDVLVIAFDGRHHAEIFKLK